jgi:hypothetical protein
MMSDAQFQDKHDEIQGMIDNLGTKLATVPEDQRNTPDYLKMQDQLAQAIQSRDAHWKSMDQPSPLVKFGKMLGKDLRFKKQAAPVPVAPPVYGQPTIDANGEKVPTGAAYKVQGPQTPEQVKAAAEAVQLQAAAPSPISPEKQATTTANANAAGNLASIQAAMKNFKTLNPNATPEEQQTYLNNLMQNTTKEQVGKWDRITGKANGQPTTLLFNEKTGKYKTPSGDDAPQEVIESFIPDPKEAKPGTSKFSVNVESYKKMHGIPADQSLTPDQLNFVEQQIALSSGASSTNITNTLKQDVNGMWVPIQESNRHVSGFGTILSDPMGKAKDEEKKSIPTTPGDVKKKAEKLKAGGTPSAAPTGGGNVKVGAPLFQGRTPIIDSAQKDVKEAVALDSLAKQVEAKPNDAFNQKRLAVALERVSAGRFTVQALDYIKQIGWGASIEQWANNMTTGALPSELARQLVDGAHENLKSKQEALKYAITPIGATTPNAGGATGSDIPKPPTPTKPGPKGAGMAYNRTTKKWHWSTNGTDDLGPVE